MHLVKRLAQRPQHGNMPILLGAFSHFYSVTYRRMLGVLLYYVTLLASSCSLQILHSNLFIMSGKFVFFYFSHHSLALPAPLCTFHVQIHISLFLFIRSAIFILLPIVLNTYSTTIILMHSSFNIPSCLRLLLFYQNSVFCMNVFSPSFFAYSNFFHGINTVQSSHVLKELFFTSICGFHPSHTQTHAICTRN